MFEGVSHEEFIIPTMLPETGINRCVKSWSEICGYASIVVEVNIVRNPPFFSYFKNTTVPMD